jgi:leucyl-tRNA synthetase
MFIGPFENAAPWSDSGLVGVRRFLERVWRLSESVIEKKILKSDQESILSIHRTIQKVSDDIEAFKFNTAVSSLMICLNEIQDLDISISDFSQFISLLAPFAPHATEEIWGKLGYKYSIHISEWPTADKKLLRQENITLPIQINGKVRSQINVPVDIGEDELKQRVFRDQSIQKYIHNKEPKKIIIVTNRVVNIVL